MESNIGEKIVELLKPLISASYIQAEVNTFPYCAYDIESQQPIRSKHAILGYNADVSIYIVDRNETNAATLKDRVIATLVREGKFDFALQNITATTENNHWAYRLEYNIKQIF